MLRVLALLVLGLACAPVAARGDASTSDPGHVIDAWVPGGAAEQSERALAGGYTGFGAITTGGEGRPVLVVDSLADYGSGSLRSALDAAGRLGGGRIVFAVGGDVVPRSELVVPANTTIDGLTAPPPGITLFGDRLSTGGGVLEIHAGNVIVRGLRIRNAANDGIQVSAKRGVPIARVVVDHCSITNSGDGGIDLTGADGALVSDVTLSWNYLAANGGPCTAKSWCGGGSLVKYGATRVSVHANVWDKNLRRTPSIVGDAPGSLTDLRGNVVRGYVESGMQLRDGARGNVVGNFFAGARPLLTSGAEVFAAGNDGAVAASVASPFDVAEPLDALTPDAVLASAGALPFDATDAAYRDQLATYEDAKNAVVAPAGSTGDTTLGAATAPLAPATLAAAGRMLRSARAARTQGDHARAALEYAAILDLLGSARGMYARPAEAVMAAAALGLADLARADPASAMGYALTAVDHARRSGDARLERRTLLRLRRLAR